MSEVTTQSVTYLLSMNESDLIRLYEERESHRPLYVYSYVDIIVLATVTLMSFTCNAALAASIVQSLSPFRVTLLGLTTLHIVDGVFDTAVAIAYMTRVIWDFGIVPCQVNAFVIQVWLFVLPATLFHAGLIVLDGTTAVHQKRKQTRSHAWAVVSTWALGSFVVIHVGWKCGRIRHGKRAVSYR